MSAGVKMNMRRSFGPVERMPEERIRVWCSGRVLNTHNYIVIDGIDVCVYSIMIKMPIFCCVLGDMIS